MRAEVEDDSPAAPITNKFGHPEVNKQLAGSAAGKFKDDEVHHILPNYFYAKECFHTQITGKKREFFNLRSTFLPVKNIGSPRGREICLPLKQYSFLPLVM